MHRRSSVGEFYGASKTRSRNIPASFHRWLVELCICLDIVLTNAEISGEIKGERLRFVEAMKEATVINVQSESSTAMEQPCPLKTIHSASGSVEKGVNQTDCDSLPRSWAPGV